ncbi:endoplasmic reticulum-Golgi intermediate compartment protein 2-like isoform X2 [Dendronephthya gigantea]|uniref:endoplasmic reticulum-Golgi intermediate compartment protein 2-like isoform X2 n=1 Tax=Dendronephthya gigantea TaxID=151771 RepID=UPI00106C561B|nr:endoplasmic reticulum-Golgi intermediate compartment protein 2-like isoform X2 [Dendronephthya gigantea]
MRRLGSELRQRKHLKVIQDLDAFPKVPESYQKTTASGGTVSILTFLFIGILIISEFQYYRATDIQYNYEVDADADSKLQINVDITIAMQCQDIGADILDLSGATIEGENIKEEATFFELAENQKEWLRKFQEMKSTKEGYRTINEIELFERNIPTAMPQRDDLLQKSSSQPDSCRFFGSFAVNKVAGNFHVTVGKSIPHPRGHAHLSAFVPSNEYNFTHRIDHLSFGPRVPGVISALDGDIQVTHNNLHTYHYYIKIVPTSIKMLSWRNELKTNQYSVTQRSRKINHAGGSHGVSGVFFKYDLSSILVRVREVHRPFWQFLVRLCGIVGGIFATSGMLHSLVGFFVEKLYCQFSKNKDSKSALAEDTKESPISSHHIANSNGLSHQPVVS